MNVEALLRAEPTLNENISKGLYLWLRQQPWRYYHSAVHEDVENLTNRFMHSHGLAPGPISDATLASSPISILRFRSNDGGTVTGAQYLNGGVVIQEHWPQPPTIWLMVTEETARAWGYPDTELDYHLFTSGGNDDGSPASPSE